MVQGMGQGPPNKRRKTIYEDFDHLGNLEVVNEYREDRRESH